MGKQSRDSGSVVRGITSLQFENNECIISSEIDNDEKRGRT